MAQGSHIGSFAEGFINAFLQARRQRMYEQYFRMLMLKNGYNPDTGKYTDPAQTIKDIFKQGHDSGYTTSGTPYHGNGLTANDSGYEQAGDNEPSIHARSSDHDNQVIQNHIIEKSNELGRNPHEALNVWKVESRGGTNMVGDGGSSFGDFQLHIGGINPSMPHPGLGDALAKEGIDPRKMDLQTRLKAVDFALEHAAQHGWGDWENTRQKLGLPHQWSTAQADQPFQPYHVAGAMQPPPETGAMPQPSPGLSAPNMTYDEGPFGGKPIGTPGVTDEQPQATPSASTSQTVIPPRGSTTTPQRTAAPSSPERVPLPPDFRDFGMQRNAQGVLSDRSATPGPAAQPPASSSPVTAQGQMGHYIPTTGIGRGPGTYVQDTPNTELHAPPTWTAENLPKTNTNPRPQYKPPQTYPVQDRRPTPGVDAPNVNQPSQQSPYVPQSQPVIPPAAGSLNAMDDNVLPGESWHAAYGGPVPGTIVAPQQNPTGTSSMLGAANALGGGVSGSAPSMGAIPSPGMAAGMASGPAWPGAAPPPSTPSVQHMANLQSLGGLPINYSAARPVGNNSYNTAGGNSGGAGAGGNAAGGVSGAGSASGW